LSCTAAKYGLNQSLVPAALFISLFPIKNS
jgi:hypothetical protein